MSLVEDALGHIDPAGITALVTEIIDIPSPMRGEAALARYLEKAIKGARINSP